MKGAMDRGNRNRQLIFAKERTDLKRRPGLPEKKSLVNPLRKALKVRPQRRPNPNTSRERAG